jgi:long-chain fatty acid transport protein
MRSAHFGAAAVAGLTLAIGAAHAGGFAVREQSAYFLGSAFAGSAAGGDLSSMYWNSAATATGTGCNASASLTAVFGQAIETAQSGILVTGPPTSNDVGTAPLVPSTFAACQLTDRLYLGLGLNAPFGITTKPDNTTWAGSPVAITSKVFSFDINPTLAYKLTPELTVGIGVQIEFLSARLNHGPFNSPFGPLLGARAFDADDWGVGATAGILWQPVRGTSVGLGYRSAVNENVGGDFTRGFGLGSGPAVMTTASAGITLPDEVTLSARQYLTPQVALLGTIEWQNWSRVQNITATSAGCLGGVCEVLNLNYHDGWFYSIGAEYILNPAITLRAGVAYETSPIQDSTRDILVPDSNRVELAAGASFKYSDWLTFDVGYSHLFFQDGTYCIASPAFNGTTHCNAATPAPFVLISGKSDVAADLLTFGLKYKF